MLSFEKLIEIVLGIVLTAIITSIFLYFKKKLKKKIRIVVPEIFKEKDKKNNIDEKDIAALNNIYAGKVLIEGSYEFEPEIEDLGDAEISENLSSKAALYS